MTAPAFSLPVAIAIAVIGVSTTFWAVFRAVRDHHIAKEFRDRALASADDDQRPALDALFASERALALVCVQLNGQDWVVGQRLIHAAEVRVFNGLSDPDTTRRILDDALHLVESRDFDAAWRVLV